MELKVYKIDGTESGKSVVLDDAIFAIEPNDDAIYLDVKQYLANRRQGTHKTKERWKSHTAPRSWVGRKVVAEHAMAVLKPTSS